jgi:hypothetical protein
MFNRLKSLAHRGARIMAAMLLALGVSTLSSGCFVLEDVDYNFFTSRVQNKRSIVFEDGRHIEQSYSVRLYSLHELGKILHHANFRVLEVSGNFSHRNRYFGADSPQIILLAEKRPPK